MKKQLMASSVSQKNNFPNLALNAFLFLISVLALSRLALEQGYPLLYSDSISYLASGSELQTPVDRPLAYGLFINFFSLGKSLFFVVFVQAAMLSFMIYRMCSMFIQNSHFLNFLHLCLCLLLTFFSGVSWYVSHLIPDIFTPILLLSIISVIGHKPGRFSTLDVFIGTLALPMHSSHIVFVFLLLLILCIGILLPGLRKLILGSKKTVLRLGLLLACGVVMGLSMNYRGGGGFNFSRGGHMFVMARLCGSGILKDFLQQNCKSQNYPYSLCARAGSLPEKSEVFLWNDSVYYDAECLLQGGWGNCWEKRREEYYSVFGEILMTFPYNIRFISHVMTNTLEQLSTFRIDPVFPQPETLPYEYFISRLLPSDVPLVKKTPQWIGMVRFDNLNMLQNSLLAISSLMLLFFVTLFKDRGYKKLRFLILFLLLLLVSNAFICGAFSDVVPRYQGRIIWLIPLFSVLFAFALYHQKKVH
jgi:hypothetical protein